MSKPVFEHRHYKVIAAILAEAAASATEPQYVALGGLDRGTVRNITEMFANGLQGTNPNFNRDRFLAAARGEPSNGRDRVR